MGLGPGGGINMEIKTPSHKPSQHTHTQKTKAALLFYSLMVGNPLFLDSTLARGDVELLFLPLLQQVRRRRRRRTEDRQREDGRRQR